MVRGYRLYTDGSSHARGGLPGGWAWILVRLCGDGVQEPLTSVPVAAKSGGDPETSNNRMELTGILEGLHYVAHRMPADVNVEVCSDSQYALNMAAGLWNASSNQDIIGELRKLVEILKATGATLTFSWVRGHAGEPWNERVDGLATTAKAKVIKDLTNTPHL